MFVALPVIFLDGGGVLAAEATACIAVPPRTPRMRSEHGVTGVDIAISARR